jgi:uncharacterized membrane protein AbrB (regulator of aidB expression)
MPRRSNPLTYLALGWLVALVLAAHAGIPAPDGFGLAILALTIWSLGYLYYRLCRRWPLAGWLMLGFFVGLFGGSSAATTHEYDDSGCDNYDCDGN